MKFETKVLVYSVNLRKHRYQKGYCVHKLYMKNKVDDKFNSNYYEDVARYELEKGPLEHHKNIRGMVIVTCIHDKKLVATGASFCSIHEDRFDIPLGINIAKGRAYKMLHQWNNSKFGTGEKLPLQNELFE